MSLLRENIAGVLFRGTLVNGLITITGYYDENASSITTNSMRGAVIIANGRVNGYVANNTAWASGGIQLWQAGSGKSISGLVDFSFVFPAGRLSMNYMMIESIAMGRHDYDDNATLDMLSMGRTPTGSDASQCTIKMNANRNNAITNDMDTFTPQEVRVRGGVKVEF